MKVRSYMAPELYIPTQRDIDDMVRSIRREIDREIMSVMEKELMGGKISE